MPTVHTFWSQLTRGVGNKVVFYGILLLAIFAGVCAVLRLDGVLDALTARLAFAAFFGVWCINILITWLQSEQQAQRAGRPFSAGDIGLIVLAVLGLAGAALAVSPWAYVAAILGTVWIAAICQPDSKLIHWNPMEAVPRAWAIALAVFFTVAFGLGVVAALAF
jgi:hypothetical protein